MVESSDFAFDFFVSRRGAAAELAREVSNVLESAGYRVKVQDYDFDRGGNFVGDIHDALLQARHLFILHTRDYDQNHWTRQEFTNFLAAAAVDKSRRVCILCCDDAAPRGILANVVFGDITTESDPERRRTIILDVARGNALAKRAEAPVFGGAIPSRNVGFVGREDVLQRISESFDATTGAAERCIVAIVGLGGTGKSALARAFVERRGDAYIGVWWLPAETVAGLVAEFANLATRLDPRLDADADIEKRARLALRKLESNDRPFLLVLDNLTQHDVLDEWLPARGAHVLVTTRLTDWAGRAHEIELSTMTEAEATAFLQARANRKDPNGARDLAARLGYLPLALDHAAAYVRQAAISFENYGKRAEVLMAKAPRGATYPSSIAATFSLAIEDAGREASAAEKLIGYLAFVAPERIPIRLRDALVGDADGDEALMTLSSRSLVRIEEDTDGDIFIWLHRLVQDAARARLSIQGETGVFVAHLLSVMAAEFPADAYDNPECWKDCDRLLPHALRLRDHTSGRTEARADYVALCNRTGEFLHGRASYALAEALFRDAIETAAGLGEACEKIHDESLCRLANLLRNTARASEAEPILQGVLLRQRQRPESRLDCARTLTSLAGLLHETGRAKDAEPLLREAIALGEADLGRTHPEVATRLNNLARLLQELGSTGEAEALFREAIASGEKSLGRHHVMIGDRLNNLAKLLHDRGAYPEAEALYREAVAAGVAALADDHPNLAIRRHNLANLLRDTDRASEAEPLYRSAISSFIGAFGEKHPVVARARRNLAEMLATLGRGEEARTLASAAADALAASLGDNHPWTKDAVATLAAAKAAG